MDTRNTDGSAGEQDNPVTNLCFNYDRLLVEEEPEIKKGPGSGNRTRCPNCKSFGTKHPLHLCKKCGGGTIRCVLEKCNEAVEWVGYAEGNKEKGIPAKPGVPCRYCHVHRYRLEPSPFRDSFNTDFNEERHGWRQTISEDFPVVGRGY